ncbi:hypothetical protein HD806DRAFT_481213, partial [Xylariaceae sp. AK1471]
MSLVEETCELEGSELSTGRPDRCCGLIVVIVNTAAQQRARKRGIFVSGLWYNSPPISFSIRQC